MIGEHPGDAEVEEPLHLIGVVDGIGVHAEPQVGRARHEVWIDHHEVRIHSLSTDLAALILPVVGGPRGDQDGEPGVGLRRPKALEDPAEERREQNVLAEAT